MVGPDSPWDKQRPVTGTRTVREVGTPGAPKRARITNLALGQTLTAQFNPQGLSETIEVTWEKLAVVGMSHRPQQYMFTDNLALDVEFEFDELSAEQYGAKSNLRSILRARRFMHALCYGRTTPVVDPEPPEVAIVWPGLYAIRTRVHRLEIHIDRFVYTSGDAVTDADIDPTCSHFTAKLKLEESRILRLGAEEVIRLGTQRASISQGSSR